MSPIRRERYQFPTLKELRKALDARYGLHDWPDGIEAKWATEMWPNTSGANQAVTPPEAAEALSPAQQ